MAKSPSHRWGQIIGQEFLEVAIEPLLRDIANRNKLYLDRKGLRRARIGRKITWQDLYGNVHDLDYVLERGGTDEKIGTPVGFIETAWRRYTKHSRNKAQEIQGAILPLIATHQNHAPFFGVLLAGVFTSGALTQLKSLGFRIVHFPYDLIVSVFAAAGIDAGFDEDTPDSECARKVRAWEALSASQRRRLGNRLLAANAGEVKQFRQALEEAIVRQVRRVLILPLHGTASEVDSIGKAIALMEAYNEKAPAGYPLARYEIVISYDNGDVIKGEFKSKEDAIVFLASYQPLVQPAT